MIIIKKEESVGYLYAIEKGGAGSGNFGHAGVPGEVGGSASGAGGGGGKDTSSEAVDRAGRNYDKVRDSIPALREWNGTQTGLGKILPKIKDTDLQKLRDAFQARIDSTPDWQPGTINLLSKSRDLLDKELRKRKKST